MTFNTKICLLFILGIFINFYSLSQVSDTIQLKQIIAMGSGLDVNMWCGQEDVLLEIDDSSLIRFDEYRTFEIGLNLEEPITLSNKVYRILLQKENETIQFRTFTKDSVSKFGDLIVSFKPERCCFTDVRYVFFLKDTLQYTNTYCSDINSIMKFVKESEGRIELIGVKSDSISINETKERIEYFKNILMRNGVSGDKVTAGKVIYEHEISSGFLRGSAYSMVYPENADREEIGVLIRIID